MGRDCVMLVFVFTYSVTDLNFVAIIFFIYKIRALITNIGFCWDCCVFYLFDLQELGKL